MAMIICVKTNRRLYERHSSRCVCVAYYAPFPADKVYEGGKCNSMMNIRDLPDTGRRFNKT